MFKIGEEVVCVDDEMHEDLQHRSVSVYDLGGLRKGEKYHIRWCGYVADSTLLHVRLEEIFREPVNSDEEEPPFFAFRFNRAVKQKTSIEVFKKMLGPKQTKKVKILEKV